LLAVPCRKGRLAKEERMIRDPKLGERLRDAAIAAVSAGSATWQPLAQLAVYEAACTKQYLTTDDMWEVHDDHGVTPPEERRAMAGPVRSLINKGVLVPTGSFKPTDAPEAHRRPKRVYESAVYGEPVPTWPS
jgi:hypothetical protein